jgi:hypothetical protein
MSDMQKANLDALIPREDFEVEQEGSIPPSVPSIRITDLEREYFFTTC